MKIRRVVLYIIIVITITIFNFYLRPIKGNNLVTKEYQNSSAYINKLYMSDEYFKKELLDKKDYYIYEKIISASVNNESSVTINCNDDCQGKFMLAYDSIYLDHPELLSFRGIASFMVYEDRITYHNYDNLSKLRSTLGALRIEREMENIRKDTKKMNDKEKIIYVYDYVASHNYDRMFTYMGTNQSAYSFFTKKTSVCAGFAKAAQIIFQNIGINSYLVFSEDHMWNYVEYEGKYYIFDATVGTSYYDKSHENYYDGLGETTTGEITGKYEELYPKIEKKALKLIFDI